MNGIFNGFLLLLAIRYDDNHGKYCYCQVLPRRYWDEPESSLEIPRLLRAAEQLSLDSEENVSFSSVDSVVAAMDNSNRQSDFEEIIPIHLFCWDPEQDQGFINASRSEHLLPFR